VRDPVVLRNLAECFHSLARNAADPHEAERLSRLARECELHAAEWDRQSAVISASSHRTAK
jgi:hypothetical protein